LGGGGKEGGWFFGGEGEGEEEHVHLRIGFNFNEFKKKKSSQSGKCVFFALLFWGGGLFASSLMKKLK
jgi:hypothetical protein